MKAEAGGAVLIDLHSMPRQPSGVPQMVVGDRYGITATAALADHCVAVGEGQGLIVSRNMPYAGGHGVCAHGKPHRGIEAVQIELDRSLYLDDRGRPLDEQCDNLARFVLRLAETAASHVFNKAALRWAAE